MGSSLWAVVRSDKKMTGVGIKETWMKVGLLEMSARSILLAMQAGKINELNREAVRDLIFTSK